MSNGPWRFNPREITRSVKAVRSTGLPVRNIEIARDGTIRIHVGGPDRARGSTAENEWDEVFSEGHGTH